MKRQRARQLLPPGAPRQSRSCRSALRELEAAAGLHAAVLLALDHAAVARQEPALLEGRTQLRLEVGERLGNAVAHRAGLTGETAARHRGHDVELVQAVGGLQGLP